MPIEETPISLRLNEVIRNKFFRFFLSETYKASAPFSADTRLSAQEKKLIEEIKKIETACLLKYLNDFYKEQKESKSNTKPLAIKCNFLTGSEQTNLSLEVQSWWANSSSDTPPDALNPQKNLPTFKDVYGLCTGIKLGKDKSWSPSRFSVAISTAMSLLDLTEIIDEQFSQELVLRQSTDLLQQDIESLRAEKENLSKEIQSLQSEKNILSEEVTKKKSLVDNLTQRAEQLQSSLSNSENNNKQLSKKLDSTMTAFTELTRLNIFNVSVAPNNADKAGKIPEYFGKLSAAINDPMRLACIQKVRSLYDDTSKSSIKEDILNLLASLCIPDNFDISSICTRMSVSDFLEKHQNEFPDLVTSLSAFTNLNKLTFESHNNGSKTTEYFHILAYCFERGVILPQDKTLGKAINKKFVIALKEQASTISYTTN